jgi:hypothetical protein
MGLKEIDRKIRKHAKMKEQKAKMLLDELELMAESTKGLLEQLEALEKKWEQEIDQSPELSHQISQLRIRLGLPERPGAFKKKAAPGIWERLTKQGSYFAQLGVEILDIAKEKKEETGGLLSLAELILLINKRNPSWVFAPQDVIRAVELLEKEELIPGIRTLESGVKVVEFFPLSLAGDEQQVLNLAAKMGWITLEQLIAQGWSKERATRALNSLQNNGIAQEDKTYAEGTRYYFPSLS